MSRGLGDVYKRQEDALRKANTKFTRRFNYIEDQLKAQGSSVEDADLEKMDMIWNEIRKRDNRPT